MDKTTDNDMQVELLRQELKSMAQLCREKKWYASAVYISRAEETLCHMAYLGDKTQRPDFFVTLTEIHHSQFPE